MWSTFAVLLIATVAGNKCPDDVLAAIDDFAQLRTKIINTFAECKADAVKCVANLRDVLEDIGGAMRFLNDTTSDCGSDGFFCDKTISDLTIVLGNATKTVAKATKECSHGGDPKCKAVVVNAINYYVEAAAGIVKLVYDCSSTELIAPTDDDGCAADFEQVASSFEELMADVVGVINGCLSNIFKCQLGINYIMEEVKKTTTVIENFILHCAGPCGNEMGKVVTDLVGVRDAISRSLKDCVHGPSIACVADLGTVSGDIYSASVDMAQVVSVCTKMTKVTY